MEGRLSWMAHADLVHMMRVGSPAGLSKRQAWVSLAWLLLGLLVGTAATIDPLGTVVGFVALVAAAVLSLIGLRPLPVGLLLVGVGIGALLVLLAIGFTDTFSLSASGTGRCTSGVCSTHQEAAVSIPAWIPGLASLGLGAGLLWKVR